MEIKGGKASDTAAGSSAFNMPQKQTQGFRNFALVACIAILITPIFIVSFLYLTWKGRKAQNAGAASLPDKPSESGDVSDAVALKDGQEMLERWKQERHSR